LESLACGTPIIGWAPQVAELENWWTERVGFPFDARRQNASDLAELILRALEDPILRDRPRKRLAALARDSFSIDRYGAETLRQYRILLGEG
jgi:glycosyltransferase involved in cell wall biosynthesis